MIDLNKQKKMNPNEWYKLLVYIYTRIRVYIFLEYILVSVYTHTII